MEGISSAPGRTSVKRKTGMKYIKRNKEINTIEEAVAHNMGLPGNTDVKAVINQWYKNSAGGNYQIPVLEEIRDLAGQFKNRPVWIFGDYDCDGVCATSILHTALAMDGFSNVRYLLPERSKGYGMSRGMVDMAEEKTGPGLIITVDNGISAMDAVDYAKEKGFTVIVTDHHLPKIENGAKVLPNADLILDPNAIDHQAPFAGYCGAGLAYKLAIQLIGKKAEGLLPYCAIATCGDQMELREENYVFVRKGLAMINRGICPLPIKALIAANMMEYGHFTSSTLSFRIVPELNAPGRIDEKEGAALSCELLLSHNYDFALEIAQQIVEINNKRKEMLKSESEICIEELEKNGQPSAPVITVDESAESGIVGILAAKLQEKYHFPSIVFTADPDNPETLRGSARSVEGFSIIDMLRACSSCLESFGGHEGAAGVRVRRDKLEEFRSTAASYIRKKGCTFTSPDIGYYDLEIDSKDIAETIKSIEMFAPYGNGNPMPVFKVNGFVPIPFNRYNTNPYVRQLAGTGIKFTSYYCDALNFEKWDDMKQICGDRPITFYGTLDTNYFQGKETAQITFSGYEKEAPRRNAAVTKIFG